MATTFFELTVQDEDAETTRISVAGAIDLSCVCDFDDALRRVERNGPARLVVDLRRLEFMDSAGLSRLVALHTRCRRAGRRLTLVRGPEALQRLLALSRLDEYLDIIAEPLPAA
jgi:anti-sigma B factor antagonist